MRKNQPDYGDHPIYLEEEVSPGEWREDEYLVQHVEYNPDPETDELFFGEILYSEDCKGEGVKISEACFFERYAKYHDLVDDPIIQIRPPRKTAMQHAEEHIRAEIGESCAKTWSAWCERLEDEREAAMEDRHESMREDRLVKDY